MHLTETDSLPQINLKTFLKHSIKVRAVVARIQASHIKRHY